MKKTEVVDEKILVWKIGAKNNYEITKKLNEIFKKPSDFTFKR